MRRIIFASAIVWIASGWTWTSPARGAEPFEKGTYSLTVTSAYIPPIRFSEDHLLNLTLSGGYYFWDNNSLNLELQGYWADQDFDSDVYIAGLGILGRWHFLRRDRWSLFLDGGGGVSYADQEFPQHPYDGTNFNFTGKVGGGGTWALGDGAHLIAGVRYFHLSNGQIRGKDDNPTYDGLEIWGGMMWTW